MSLDSKIKSILSAVFPSALPRKILSYSLAGSILLGNVSCGKDEEGDEYYGGTQRYACQMNSCVPDESGPYAVADCNNDCGGNNEMPLPQGDYLTATIDETLICPLGWTRNLGANANGQYFIDVTAMCEGSSQLFIRFEPVQPVGVSTPCTQLGYHDSSGGGEDVICKTTPSGSATITGTPGAYRVSGNCNCEPYAAEFSLPLMVQ